MDTLRARAAVALACAVLRLRRLRAVDLQKLYLSTGYATTGDRARRVLALQHHQCGAGAQRCACLRSDACCDVLHRNMGSRRQASRLSSRVALLCAGPPHQGIRLCLGDDARVVCRRACHSPRVAPAEPRAMRGRHRHSGQRGPGGGGARRSPHESTFCQKVLGHACDGRYVPAVVDRPSRFVRFDLRRFVLRMDTLPDDPDTTTF